jgi:sulfopyruvate decarboxylase TPP-binding subunit
MGQATQPILEACGFLCMRVEEPDDMAPAMQAACTMVFQAGQAVAVLLTQRLLGAKAF